MGLHHDLLEQARQLAQHEPRRPKQASLRRAVSAAYYSLFHFTTEQAARALVSGRDPSRRRLRRSVRRSFDHAHMRREALAIARGRGRWHDAVDIRASAELIRVATVLASIQEERHRADYDHAHTLLRSEVRTMIADVAEAKRAWKAIRGTPEADAFLVAMLLRLRA